MLTHQGHIDAMSHAVGGLNDKRVSLLEWYNQAGRSLFSEHPWRWRVVGPLQLPLPTTPSDYIDLPLDFGNLVHITVNSAAFRVNLVDIRQIMELRRGRVVNTAGGVWISLDGNAPPVGGQPGFSKRMAVYPPVPNGVSYFLLAYEMCWREAVADKLDQYPNLPPFMDAALDFKARALARNLTKQSSTIEEAMYREEVERAKGEDARRQIEMGPLRGGADDFASVGKYAQGISTVGFSAAPT
jgi:hypothetical protein